MKTELTYHVLYADTDAMGVVYYGNYLRIYEAARHDFMFKAGLSFAVCEQKNIIMPVLNVNITYIKPVRLFQQVKITSEATLISETRMLFKHTIIDSNNALLNSADVTFCFINAQTLAPTRCPEFIRNALNIK